MVMVFGFLILISTDFLRFYFTTYSWVLDSIKKIYQTLELVFKHIFNHLKVHEKYSAMCHISNSLVSVWKCGQTRSLMFDILHLNWEL